MSEKIEKCLEVFYNQPGIVIQWTPDKKHYSWGIVGPSRAALMLQKLLDILTSEESTDGN